MLDPKQGMRNVWILTCCMTVLSICYTMLIPFLPVYLLELGVPQADVAMWSGGVFSITFFLAGVMAPVWGKLADKKGKKLMALRAGVGLGISYLLMGFVSGPWELMGARAFQGFANGFVPAAMTMASLSVPKEKLGNALGIFQTGLIVGNVIGPLIGGIVEAAIGMRPLFYITGVVLFILTAVVAFFVEEPKVDQIVGSKSAGNNSIWDDLRVAKQNKTLLILLGLFFVMQSAMMMLQPVLALYIGEMRGSMVGAAMVAGSILSIGGLAGVITTNLWAGFGQRKGYFKAICYALGGTGLFILLQSLPLGIWWFAVLQVLVGCFIVGVNPSLSAAVTTCTEPDFRGRVFGLTTTAQMFGSMMGPLFASVVTTYIGIQYVFMTTGVVLSVASYNLYKRYVTTDK